jgi:hypothetical protein
MYIIDHASLLFPGVDSYDFLKAYELTTAVMLMPDELSSIRQFSDHNNIRPKDGRLWMEWTTEHISPMRQGAYIVSGDIDPKFGHIAIKEHYIGEIIANLGEAPIAAHYQFFVRDDLPDTEPRTWVLIYGWAMGPSGNPFVVHAFGVYLDQQGKMIDYALYAYDAMHSNTTIDVVLQLSPIVWCLRAMRRFRVGDTTYTTPDGIVVQHVYPYQIHAL